VARTTRRRRRKHRGTQGGGIDRRGRARRPSSRQEARARARKQLGQKRERVPTWGSAVGRGAFGAGVFFLLLVTIFGRPVAPSFALAALMLLIYIPLGHFIDRFFYNRRQAARRRERERRARGE
jgi:drug/metabolite transporter (DMT)-like permease